MGLNDISISRNMFLTMRMVAMAGLPVTSCYLVWLINWCQRLRSNDTFYPYIISHTNVAVTPVVVSCLSIVAIPLQFYGLTRWYNMGAAGVERSIDRSMLFFVVCSLVLVVAFAFTIFYAAVNASVAKGQVGDGITEAMSKYASEQELKTSMDRLQTMLRCCGRYNYKEWFYVQWIPLTFSDKRPKSVGGFVTDAVPYSCCSTEVMFPCIHYGVMHPSTVYKYAPEHQLTLWPSGCQDRVTDEMFKISCQLISAMLAIMVIMTLECIIVRYMQTAIRNGMSLSTKEDCKAYLICSGSPDSSSNRYTRRIRKIMSQFNAHNTKDKKLKSGGVKYVYNYLSDSDYSDCSM